MKKVVVFCCFLFTAYAVSAQLIQDRLKNAWQQFASDSQLKHALVSFYVTDAETGEVIFDRNSQLGLAPASTQKIITSVTALELLGPSFRYATAVGLLQQGGKENIVIRPSGDPTFGSNRYATTKPERVLNGLWQGLQLNGYKGTEIRMLIDTSGFETMSYPDGWIWQDMGNYYGAGAGPLNWRENQFDISFKTGDKQGSPSSLVLFNGSPVIPYSFLNEVKAGPKGSGDNAYIYLPVGSNTYTVRGTVPPGENKFTISGAAFSGSDYWLKEAGAFLRNKTGNSNAKLFPGYVSHAAAFREIGRFFSPSLDSIIYWFNKKSINLYGEALLRTIAREKAGYYGVDSGLAVLHRFWKEQGLDPEELNMYDGSGLSPLNRVTTHAQVSILKFARSRDWFSYFYTALPEYNGMKMKSGTISDVKGFCGYQKGKDGREYIFSLLVNNYSGRTSPLVNKMYVLLDEMKK